MKQTMSETYQEVSEIKDMLRGLTQDNINVRPEQAFPEARNAPEEVDTVTGNDPAGEQTHSTDNTSLRSESLSQPMNRMHIQTRPTSPTLHFQAQARTPVQTQTQAQMISQRRTRPYHKSQPHQPHPVPSTPSSPPSAAEQFTSSTATPSSRPPTFPSPSAPPLSRLLRGSRKENVITQRQRPV
jgi:hypothetical protein